MHQSQFSFLENKRTTEIKLRVSVMGLFIKANTVLMIHKITGPKPGCWDLPGGGLIPNEPLMQALKREIKEEIGIENFQVESLLMIAEDFFLAQSGKPLHSLSIIYKCSFEEGPLLFSSDLKEVGAKGIQWMPVTELSPETCTTRSWQALEAAYLLTPQQKGESGV
jgi:8-oxo-dGTP diphosphatase